MNEGHDTLAMLDDTSALAVHHLTHTPSQSAVLTAYVILGVALPVRAIGKVVGKAWVGLQPNRQCTADVNLARLA